MDRAWADVRQAARRLRRTPGFSGIVVLILALGIGANSALFTVAHALLLQPLPVSEIDRVVVPTAMQGQDPFNVSAHEYQAVRTRPQLFERCGAARRRPVTLRSAGEPLRLEGAEVSPGYLPTLGAKAFLGRLFLPGDAREGAVVVLGHALWQRSFGGDPAVVGRSLRLDGQPTTVVGILPPGLDIPFGTEVYTAFEVEDLPTDALDLHNLLVLARLRDGVKAESAAAELKDAMAVLAREHPQSQRGFGMVLVPLRSWTLGDVQGRVPGRVGALLAAVSLLLLIACANVAGLLLARSAARRREMALRRALGAGRMGLARLLLVESLLLALAGGAGGLLVGHGLARALFALSPVQPIALAGAMRPSTASLPVLGFTLAVSLLTGLVFSLVPGIGAGKGDVVLELRDEGRVRGPGAQGRRILDLLVGAEVALALVLLTGAGLALRSLDRLLGLDLGYRADRVAMATVAFPEDAYRESSSRTAFGAAVVERLRALPGVTGAGAVSQPPLADFGWDAVYACEGRPEEPERLRVTAHRLVTPGYLEALGVRLVAGRLIEAGDHEGALPVAVVSESLARDCFPGQEAAGRRVRWMRRLGSRPWMTIVGVVAEVKEDRAAFRRDRPVWYLPLAQQPPAAPELTFVVRSGGDPGRLAAPLRRAVAEVDPALPVFGTTTLRAHVGSLLGPEQFSPMLLSLFASLGLVLALAGVGGAVTWTAASRRQEVGVRLALGATRRDVEALLVRQGMRPVLAGAAAGLLGALALSRVAARFLFGVDGRDPATLVCVTGALLLASAAAAWAPARRAARADPSRVLRLE